MGKWAISTFSEALLRSRFDAEYHSHEARGLDDWLIKRGVNLVPLKLICSRMTSGHTPLRHDLSKGEIPFVTVECVSPLYVDFAGGKRVEERHYDGELQRVALNKASVVVTIKRRIGQASPCYQLHGKASSNQYVAVLELKPERNPGFVSAYLNSSFGQRLADRERTEQMNPYLPVGSLGKLLIPVIDIKKQEQIDEIVRRRFELLSDSNRLYTQAQQILESELGLDELEFEKPVGYTARFSELEESRRADAQHYQPRFAHLMRAVERHNPARIRAIRTLNRRGVQPEYVEGGDVAAINSQHLGPNHLAYDSFARTSRKWFELSPFAHVQPDDLLIYTTGAYVGRTNVYLDDQPALASNHVNILRLTSGIDAAYMALVLQGKVGQFQTAKHARGSAQAELYPADIDKFLVPLLPASLQAEIGDLVRNSLNKQRESKSLLEQAKARVEQLIEEAVAKSGSSTRHSS